MEHNIALSARVLDSRLDSPHLTQTSPQWSLTAWMPPGGCMLARVLRCALYLPHSGWSQPSLGSAQVLWLEHRCLAGAARMEKLLFLQLGCCSAGAPEPCCQEGQACCQCLFQAVLFHQCLPQAHVAGHAMSGCCPGVLEACCSLVPFPASLCLTHGTTDCCGWLECHFSQRE